MTVLGVSILKDLILKYMVIYPSDAKAFDANGSVLTVREGRMLNYMEHRNMISREVVPSRLRRPPTSKSRFGRLELSFLNPAKVRSGCVGRLASNWLT